MSHFVKDHCVESIVAVVACFGELSLLVLVLVLVFWLWLLVLESVFVWCTGCGCGCGCCRHRQRHRADIVVIVVLDVADGVVVVVVLARLSFSLHCCRVADIVCCFLGQSVDKRFGMLACVLLLALSVAMRYFFVTQS